jgi:hypothetical protein
MIPNKSLGGDAFRHMLGIIWSPRSSSSIPSAEN